MARATTPKKTATTPPDCGKVQTQAPKGHFTPFRICHDLPEFAKLEHFSLYSSTLVYGEQKTPEICKKAIFIGVFGGFEVVPEEGIEPPTKGL